jgi:uncharacterized repeat protein (TIGR03803 family)
VRFTTRLAIVLFLSLPLFSAFGQTQKTLYSFAGGSDGAIPAAGLIFDSQGNLYGTTTSGGNSECDSSLSAGCGTVFELTPNGADSWSETVLHVFDQTVDGGDPAAPVVMDKAGNLYGSTQYYGKAGLGGVWQLIPASTGWTENNLHSFSGGSDGFYCFGLTFNSRGQLFGTTFGGGSSNNGTVFQLLSAGDDKWKETILHAFTGGSSDGNAPSDAVIFDQQGNMYGTTYEGGPHLAGTVFELQPTASGWSEQILYMFKGLAFGGGSDGANPVSGVIFDKKGNLYGTTDYGGTKSVGTVYELSPSGSGSWTEKILYTFTDGQDGGHPGGLIIDSKGNLYGVTSGHDTFGSVFELSPADGDKWTFKVLYDFQDGIDGASPFGSLVRDAHGNLYGTTEFGGANGLGTVFEVTP